MSRVILSRYEDGQERFVVGWDHPAGGAFWQEFALETDPQTGKPAWEVDEAWEEVIRYGGMFPGIPLDDFRESVPEDLRPLITSEVMTLLWSHAADLESGRRAPVDLVVTDARPPR